MTQENIMINKLNNRTDSKTGFFATIKLPCILVSALATVGFFIWGCTSIKFFSVLGIIIYFVGMLGAILSGPWKYIKVFFKFVFKGWHIGWVICPFIPPCFFTAFMGAALGMFAAIFLIFCAPITIGLYYYFKD